MAWLVYVQYEYPWVAPRGYQFSDQTAAEKYFRHLIEREREYEAAFPEEEREEPRPMLNLLISEDWVRALEPILQTAIRLDLPPRDVPSLAWVSTEELAEHLLPGLRTEDVDPEFFPGRLGAFWHTLGVIPTKTLEDDPLYVFQQIAGGLPFRTTLWVLERVWTPPPMTRREAAIAVAWRAATALDEEWRRVEELLGRDGELFPMGAFKVHPGQLWYIPVPEERRSLVLSLLDAILDGPGEAYEPPEAGLPEEVVAGMLATGRL